MIVFGRFRGMRWQVNPFVLGAEYATRAFNVWLTSGGVDSLRAGEMVPGSEGKPFKNYSTMYLFEGKLIVPFANIDMAYSTTVSDRNRKLLYLTGSGLRSTQESDLQDALAPGASLPTQLTNEPVGVPSPDWFTMAVPPGVVAGPDTVVKVGLTTAYISGQPEPDQFLGVEDVSFVYTFVTKHGEESAPSVPSALCRVINNETVLYLTMGGAPYQSTPPNGYVVGIRVYVSSGDGYFLVGAPRVTHTDVNTGIDHKLTWAYGDGFFEAQFVVNLADAEDEMVSGDWNPPPGDLAHLIVTDYNYGVGASNEGVVYLSEDNILHAWPASLEYRVRGRPKGLAQIPGGFAVLTDECAHLFAGVSSRAVQHVGSYDHGCLDKRSITRVDGGVMYATWEGVALVSLSQQIIATDGWIDRNVWLDKVNVNDCRLEWYEGRLIVMTRQADNTPIGWILNMAERDITEFAVQSGQMTTGLFRNPQTGELWLSQESPQGLVKFNRGDPLRSYWESGRIEVSEGDMLCAARMEVDEYVPTPDEAEMIIIREDQTETHKVPNNKAFRFSLKRSRWFKVAIESYRTVSFLRLGRDIGQV